MEAQSQMLQALRQLDFLIAPRRAMAALDSDYERVLQQAQLSLENERGRLLFSEKSLEDLALLTTQETLMKDCPSCQARSLKLGLCQECGYTRPDLSDELQRRLGAVLPTQHLPPQHVLIPDMERNRLLVLDLARPGQLRWEVSLQRTAIQSPSFALMLTDRRILVCDKRAQQLVLVDLLGQEIAQLAGPERLSQLRSVAVYTHDRGERRLIVAEGQRILILDLTGKLLKEITQGMATRPLQAPQFVHVTAQKHLLVLDGIQLLRYNLSTLKCESVNYLKVERAVHLLPMRHQSFQILDAGSREFIWLDRRCRELERQKLPLPQDEQVLQIIPLPGQEEFLVVNRDSAWRCRPGTQRLLGYWRLEDCRYRFRPRWENEPLPQAALAPPQPPERSSFEQALAQSGLFEKVTPQLVRMARQLSRSAHLPEGYRQDARKLTRSGLIYLEKGELEWQAERGGRHQNYPEASLIRLFLFQNQAEAGKFKAHTDSRMLILSDWAVRTLMSYSRRSHGIKGEINRADIRQRISELGQSLGQKLRKGQLLPQAKKLPLQRLCLPRHPNEHELIESLLQEGQQVVELHLKLLPDLDVSQQQLKLLQLLRHDTHLIKHAWFEQGHMLVALVAFEMPLESFQNLLAATPTIERFQLVPVLICLRNNKLARSAETKIKELQQDLQSEAWEQEA